MENRYTIPTSRSTTMDVGLRAHMSRVYNRMTLGVLVTAITAWFVASSPALMQFFLGGPQMYIVIFAPLAIIWFGFNPMRMKSSQLAISFYALSALYGISFSVILFAFTRESVAQTFFIATAMFAGLSIFGYTTKRNLDGMGTFLVMGVWGLLIASIMNMFFQNPMMSNVIAGIGIIVFSGLTAFYTQQTKEMYNPAAGDEGNSRMAWVAALNLYISFVALFQYLIQIFGQRN
jgi:uncharacterized protein